MKTENVQLNKTEYISLSELAGNFKIYERLPLPIQKALKKSIWITVIIDLVCIPILIALPGWIQSVVPLQPNGFFIWFTSDVANFVLGIASDLKDILLVLNIVSLALCIVVLIASTAMTKPAVESFHWLALLGVFPSGVSAFTALILTAFFLAAIALAIIIWIIIITVVITVFIGILSALIGGD